MIAGWHQACAIDEELGALAASCSIAFEAAGARFGFRDGRIETGTTGTPAFQLVARAADWAELFAPMPRPPYQSFFGMLMRVDGTRVDGSELAFAQHAHLVRRVLEIGREVRNRQDPDAARLGPPLTSPPGVLDGVTGASCSIVVEGRRSSIFWEHAGSGRDVLLLHTAGSDSRQFTHLLRDERLTSRAHLVAFDLPGHGRSMPAPNALPGAYRLTTDNYAETVLAVVEALELERPVVVGSSMAGEICLELAYRAPDRIGGVVACEASDYVPGRRVAWACHPLVNQALFVPEWVYGLMAPQSPLVHRREVWWHYSQGGFATFFGDIAFYSGGWDGRDRVARIDTTRCPVVMLTGEYDYSCTPAMSQATAEKIPGAHFEVMPELGHFPMAENPPRFVEHLLRALDRIDGAPES